MQIVMESSEGNRQILIGQTFSIGSVVLLYVVVGAMMSAVPGWAIGHIPPLSSDPRWPAC